METYPMLNPTTTTVRRSGNTWIIELPDDLVRSLGWKADQSIFLHHQLVDGLWLSAQDESATLAELSDFAKQVSKR